MAAHHSLTIDEEACSHYYHCTFSEVPFTATIQQVAELIVPNASDASVAKLEALGCRIVPHKLYSYKETLPRKLGYLTYYIHHRSNGTRDDEAIHNLFLQWLEDELPRRIAAAPHAQTTQVRLAQPKNCFVAGPFLKELNDVCQFLSPVHCKDPKKMETFILTKVIWPAVTSSSILPRRESVHSEETGEETSTADMRIRRSVVGVIHQQRQKDDAWGVVGKIEFASLSEEELGWLRKEHHGCHAATAAAFDDKSTSDILRRSVVSGFLSAALVPLLSVE